MKKLLALIVALLMMMTFAACDDNEKKPEATTPATTTTTGGTTDPDGTTEPDGTTVPGGTTDPDGTTVPGGTTTPDGTTVPGGTTAPDETTTPGTTPKPPVTTDPQPDPEDEEKVYTGYSGAQEMKVTVLDGKGSVSAFEKEEMPADMIEQLGLNGNVIGVMEMRIEFSSAVVSNGILTLSDAAPKAYRSASFEGTAAEEYIAIAKAQYKEMYEAGQIEKAEYDMTMALLNGEEIAMSDEDYGATNMTVKIKLNDADMTCLALGSSHEDEDGKYVWECEYTANGKATKETNYTMDGRWGNYAEMITYYPDGKAKKTFEEYDLVVDEETGECELGDLEYKSEYREDGTLKLSTRYYDDGSYRVDEYDENGDWLKETYYDKDGNEITEGDEPIITPPAEDEKFTGTETEDINGALLTYYIVEDELVKGTATFTNGTTITVFERDEDDFDKILIDCQLSGASDGTYAVLVFKYEYYDGTYNVKTALRIIYSAPDGEILDESTFEYDENGNLIVDDVTPPEGGEDLPPEEDEKFTGTQTQEMDGLLWTYYIVEDELVKETVTFTNGTTVTVYELDDLGRVKRGVGYGVGENDELEYLLVSEFTYVGDTDEIDSEKYTEYSVPDGEILYEGNNGAYEGYYEYEYAPDETLVKEYHYIPEDQYLAVTTYYEDGRTEKTWERYELYYNEAGELETRELRVLVEYDENGKEDTRTFYEPDGSYIIIEYDENEEEINRTVYEAKYDYTYEVVYEYEFEEDGYWVIEYYDPQSPHGYTKMESWYNNDDVREYSYGHRSWSGAVYYIDYYPGGRDMKTAIWYNADRTGIIDYLEYYQNGEPKSVFMEWYTGDPEVNPEPILSGYMGNRHLEDGGGIYTEEYYDLEGTPVMIGRYVVDYDFENKCEMCFEYWDYYEDGVLVRRENYYHYSYEGGA